MRHQPRRNRPRGGRDARPSGEGARRESTKPATRTGTNESFATMRSAPGKGESGPKAGIEPYDTRTRGLLGLVSTPAAAEHVGVPVVDFQGQRVDRHGIDPAAFGAPALVVRIPRP